MNKQQLEEFRQQFSLKTIKWDSDNETQSGWVFASLNSIESKNQLLDYLRSKNIDYSNTAYMIDPSWSVSKK